MPFVSEAQRRYFYANPKLHKYIPEFEAATHGHLPARKKLTKHLSKKRHGKKSS